MPRRRQPRTWKLYRRVPQPKACDFCLMLATRGAVYSGSTVTSTTTGERYHYHCRCTAEVEPDPTARQLNRISEEDANRIIHYRAYRDQSRVYRYDVSKFPRITQPPKRPVPKVGKSKVGADRWAEGPYPSPGRFKLVRGGDQITVEADQSAVEAAARAIADELDVIIARLPEWFRRTSTGEVRGIRVYMAPGDFRGGRRNSLGYAYLDQVDANGHLKIFINPKILAKGPQLRGWKMPALDTNPQLRYTLAHEIGHTFDRTETRAEYTKLVRAWKRSNSAEWQALSDYGRTKPVEAWAEAFTEWALGDRGNPAVRALADRFGWEQTEAVGKFALAWAK